MIVLSEHVDYWNHIGWKDPYSASFYSQRQSAYANRFGLDSVYTPQMVVDGTSEFVGSNSGLADKAFRKALGVPKLPGPFVLDLCRCLEYLARPSGNRNRRCLLRLTRGGRVRGGCSGIVLNRKCRRVRTPVTDSHMCPWSKVSQRSAL